MNGAADSPGPGDGNRREGNGALPDGRARSEYPRDTAAAASPSRDARWFDENQARIWTVVGGVCALLALIVTLVLSAWGGRDDAPDAAPAASRLEVSDIGFLTRQEIKARLRDFVEETVKDIEVRETAVEIIVKNAGDADALITHVELELTAVDELSSCRTGGGAGGILAAYDFAVPDDVEALPHLMALRKPFHVAAGSRESLAVFIGPEGYVGESAFLNVFVGRLTIREDSGRRLSAGRVLTVAPGDTAADRMVIDGDFQPFDPSGLVSCARDRLKTLHGLAAGLDPGNISPLYFDLTRGYETVIAAANVDWSGLSGLDCDGSIEPRPVAEIAAIADVNDDHVVDYAVVSECQAYTSAWPQVLDIYDGATLARAPKRLGRLLAEDEKRSAYGLRDVSVRMFCGVVFTEARGFTADDPNGFPSLRFEGRYRWNGKAFGRDARQGSPCI